ncbi:hypothetical protein JQ596_07725 [Bradyrhizobium manausense]|uniref:hypothetical protein n=1 Tax=Bradyrhizobium TaxID=374 RepID=UPI001BA78E39|nr:MULTISPECIES: hypothetical protein [Bradyrhizobium]MBR0825421.1 hypothetical protein [Bradyrhizobium manausense]UVO30097.1 hypothetical protein KUF59_04840 [Bradyrhizobium arachidis]
MSIIVEMLYREFCRARLAEMRKQLSVAAVSDEILQAPSKDDEPSDGDQSSGWRRKDPQAPGGWGS